MTKRVTDLEQFALEHVWRPYQTLMGHEKRLEKLPMSLEDTAKLLITDDSGWAGNVLGRIVAIGFTFPPYVMHPLVDVVRLAQARSAQRGQS